MRRGKISFPFTNVVGGISKHLFKEMLDFLPGDAKIAGWDISNTTLSYIIFVESDIFKDLPAETTFENIPNIHVKFRQITPFQPKIVESVDYTECLDSGPAVTVDASSGPTFIKIPMVSDGRTWHIVNKTPDCQHQEAFYTGLISVKKYCSKCGITLN